MDYPHTDAFVSGSGTPVVFLAVLGESSTLSFSSLEFPSGVLFLEFLDSFGLVALILRIGS